MKATGLKCPIVEDFVSSQMSLEESPLRKFCVYLLGFESDSCLCVNVIGVKEGMCQCSLFVDKMSTDGDVVK